MPTQGNARPATSWTPRPNVATGAAVGLLVSLLLAFLNAFDARPVFPDAIPALIAQFNPLVLAIVAYFAPVGYKPLYTLVAALITALLVILLAFLLAVPITAPLIVSILLAALTIIPIQFVSNVKTR